ncbi:hypothetical protein pdam_00022542 [Pocillopora damicornis]|uniref:Uncharacterized protein n=1 Tax=Pocillopora damicornis TaxID=46731 RepID=A0A3M6UMB0_POCDA|nr:hypothetical protein pdam_00022542 [Pocillopora damicornis]
MAESSPLDGLRGFNPNDSKVFSAARKISGKRHQLFKSTASPFEAVYQVPYQKDKRMKAVADGRPWDRHMPRTARRSGKGLSTRSAL